MPRRHRTRSGPPSGKKTGSKELSLEQAKALVEKQPGSAYAWKQLGARLSEQGRKQEALDALERAHALAPEDAEALAVLGRITHQMGNMTQALTSLKSALEINPRYAKAHNYVAYIYYSQSRFQDALEHAERACELEPNDVDMLNTLGNVLLHTFQYERAEEVLQRAGALEPDKYLSWNNLGNVQNALGDLDAGLDSYSRAHRAAPAAPGPYSNIITTYHYHPHKSAAEITALCKQWDKKFPASSSQHEFDIKRVADKQLRIGLISDGFRGHPVGRMITSALEAVQRHQMAFYFYSTNNANDSITERLKAIATQWMSVQPLKDDEVIEQVRGDQIDILIDLAGHNAGNRVLAVAERLAPVQIKWVGGLINTTGVQAMDYLLSDNIETPEGVDDQYVEKLIRLPDDYICYVPPNGYEPDIQALPALQNGYVTLGCFNNATKLNDELLGRWAGIMHQLPGSRLFLKSMQYQSQERCQKILRMMAENGIDSDRLVIEGPSPHAELLDAYNRVDIALDPWPYSGGLTTCEAFLMGVPVVTLPGPTFAGRHSATHLVNAGMPELVVNSWQEYEKRVLELAADLDSLSTIRQHLRQVLLESPVCDGPRFAGHFTTALRAVWQRHCEGKAPAALSIDTTGTAMFADETAPVALLEPDKPLGDSGGFTWQIAGKIVVLDNGAKLLKRSKDLDALLGLGAFGIVAFDPASRIEQTAGSGHREDLQFFPHVSLGDGQPATLHATLEPSASSTLQPLPAEDLQPGQANATQVLTQLPINTITLNSIEGLDSLDWLILDQYSDAITILEHGEQALRETLLIQVRLAFQPTHRNQPDFTQVSHWASRHGFRFYRFNDEKYISHFSEDLDLSQRQATELEAADALYLPSHERMAALSDEQRTKLAFLLDSVFGAKDTAYQVLQQVDSSQAKDYLASLAFPQPAPSEESTHADQAPVQPAQPAPTQSSNTSTDKAREDAPQRGRAGKRSSENGLWRLDEPLYVVDIGANPIDGTPPYASLLDQGQVRLVGFEPQPDALKKLNTAKGPHETYLPHAVGDGRSAKLYLCHAPGMTSTLKPNSAVLDQFQAYPIWGKVNSVESIDTVRLDDIDTIGKIDWLKIDIQGGELTVFENAEKKLENTLVIQTEANFIQLYEGQPLFADIDQWMRNHGFMLHTLLEERKRLYAPMLINGRMGPGLNQLTTADAVYIPTFERMSSLSSSDIMKLGMILHHAYGSYDLVLKLLGMIDRDSSLSRAYVKLLEHDTDFARAYGSITPGDRNRKGRSQPNAAATPRKSRGGDKGKSRKTGPLEKHSGTPIQDRTVFVVGCGHSGTTLMATILGAHPRIHTITRETSWFLGTADIDTEYAMEKEACRVSGRELICEKTPRHVFKIREIREKFPNALLIGMTRESKDVVASLKNRTGYFGSSLTRWMDDNRALLAHAADENLILIRYEDLVTKQEETMRRVLSFIGLPYSASILDFHNSNQEWFGVKHPRQTDGKGDANHLINRAWQMTQPIQDKRGGWKQLLTREEADSVDAETASLRSALGYIS